MKVRYVTSEVLIVISIVLCYVTFIHASSIVNSILEYIEDVTDYTYEVSYEIIDDGVEYSVEDDDEGSGSFAHFWRNGSSDFSFIDLADSLQSLPYDSIVRVKLQVGKTLDTSFAYICIGNLLHDGRLETTYDISGARYVGVTYIGQSYTGYTYESDGYYYIDIEGLPFVVAGIYQADIISDESDRVNILYDTLTNEALSKIKSAINIQFDDIDAARLYLCSDTEDVSTYDIESLISSLDLQILEGNAYDFSDAVLGAYVSICSVVMSVIYLFVLGNMLVVCSFWIKERSRELVIRKLHGAGNLDIVLLYARDFFRLCIYAAVITIPVECIISLYWIDARSAFSNLIVTFLVVVGSMAIVLLLMLMMAISDYKHISVVGRTYE